MRPQLRPRLPFVSLGCLSVIALVMAACTNGGNQLPPPGGPQAVINSPAEGSFTAGTFFFSVQALDPSQVLKVSFEVGGTTVGSDTIAADGFRVFVAAGDHPAGTLQLRALVTGTDGRTTTLTRAVVNVPAPPSSTSVGSHGAALGTVEEDGSLSALLVPPGAASGADITFEAMTQAEVLAATGVDYDALGITFLGAQDVSVSRGEVARTLGVSSGGFGPQVQPSQAVVNYLIGPDADGDGAGEVYVVNTASVAPNGDVVSDPVPMAQVGNTATVTQAGHSRLAPLAARVDGAPGALIAVPVAGFNPASLYGNVAEFATAAGIVQRYGRITTSEAGAQTFEVQVPPLDAGPATLTLRNLGSGYASQPVDLQITAPQPVTGTPTAVIENTLDLAQSVLEAFDASLAATGADSAVTAGLPIVERVRANLTIIENGGRPQDAATLAGLASRVVASGVDQLLAGVLSDLLGTTTLITAQQSGCNDILQRAEQGMDMVNNLTDLAGYDPPAGDTVADMHSYAFDSWWTWVKNTTLGIDEALGGNACKPDRPAPAGPGGKATPSGMGAAVPAGGNLGGNALPPGFRPIPDYSSGLAPMATELARGRFVVSVAVSGSPVPFKGTTDAGGYFMVPMIPTGQPFVAVALDTVTGENRVATGVGPALEDGVFLVFDFTSGESQVSEARWDGGGDGRLWRDAQNWEGDLLPLPNSQVIIPASAGTVELDNASGYEYRVMIGSLSLAAGATLELSRGTLEILDASTVEGDLLLTNGTLRALAPVTIRGLTTWESGGLEGTATITNQGAMTLDAGSANLRTVNGPLRNEGSVLVVGGSGSTMNFASSASFVNTAGATFEVRGEPRIQGSTSAPFDNHGLMVKTGAGTSVWSAASVNHRGGTVAVTEGTLFLWRGGVSTGATWQVTAGATLTLGRDTEVHELTGTYQGTGEGQVILAGGDSFVIGADGATFDFGGGGIEWHGAAITGPGALTNAGTLLIPRNQANGSTPSLEGTLVNLDLLVLSGDRTGGLQSLGATIDNRAGATFELRDGQDIPGANVPLILINAGTIAKSGVGESTIDGCYQQLAGGSIDPAIQVIAHAACS